MLYRQHALHYICWFSIESIHDRWKRDKICQITNGLCFNIPIDSCMLWHTCIIYERIWIFTHTSLANNHRNMLAPFNMGNLHMSNMARVWTSYVMLSYFMVSNQHFSWLHIYLQMASITMLRTFFKKVSCMKIKAKSPKNIFFNKQR